MLAFSLCLWGKTKDLHDEGGSRGGSNVAWRYATGGPGGGRGAPHGPQNSQLSKKTQAQACKPGNGDTHRRARIHKLLNPDSSCTSTHTYTNTHSPPWCQRPDWCRLLDDIVKQLHGLHDVLILDIRKRFQSGGGVVSPCVLTKWLHWKSALSFYWLTFLQDSMNSSMVTTPSLFRSIFCSKNTTTENEN